MGLTKLAALPDVPSALDLVSDPQNKQVMELILMRQEAGRPFAAPPDTPPDRVAALRKAFDATLADPAFVAEAQKTRLEIDPLTGRRDCQDAGESLTRRRKPIVVDAPPLLSWRAESAVKTHR